MLDLLTATFCCWRLCAFFFFFSLMSTWKEPLMCGWAYSPTLPPSDSVFICRKLGEDSHRRWKISFNREEIIKDETKIKEEEKVSPTYWWITMVSGSCRTWSMTAHSSSVCCRSWAGEHIWKRRTHHSVNNRKQSFCFHIEIWEIKQHYLWMGVQSSAFSHTSSLGWLF